MSPWKAVKVGNKYAIKQLKGGKWITVGHSNNKADAEASIRARYAGKHGWKPTGKKPKLQKYLEGGK
jgi:hypothetical protein